MREELKKKKRGKKEQRNLSKKSDQSLYSVFSF